MKKKIFILILPLVAILAVSCGRKEEKNPPPPVATVSGLTFEEVKAAPVEDFYQAVGSVRSRKISVLSSKVTGYVTAVHVREGDLVTPGQVLAEIDSREAANQVRAAQAGLQQAQDALAEAEQMIRASESARTAAQAEQTLAASTFKRYQILRERNSVSPQEFEEVQARFQAKSAEADRAGEMLNSLKSRREQALARIEAAKAEVSAAHLTEGYGRIRAPFAGVVTSKQVEVGTLASPGMPLLTVEDNKDFRLEAMVEESRVGKIRIGQSLRVTIDALGDREFAGKVSEISPSADPSSRSSIVKIDLPGGSQAGLRSGLFGKAILPLGQKRAMTILRKAVMERGQLTEVFVVDPQNFARLRLIKTGQQMGERVEVLSGLREGERIIVEGIEKVSEGNRVEEKGASPVQSRR